MRSKIIIYLLMFCFMAPLLGQKKREAVTTLIDVGDIELRPKIRKPELMSTLSRKRLKIKNLERRKNLIPEILDSVNQSPF